MALLWTSSAMANDDAAACFNERRYDACFREGKRRYGEEAYHEAYRAYLQGWRLQRNYEVAGNLGNVELKLGKFEGAYVHLKYSLERLPRDKKTPELVRRIEDMIREALTHVGARKLDVEPRDARVHIDGRAVELDPELWLAFAPGSYALRVEREGHQTVEKKLDVRAGEEVIVELSLSPKGAGKEAADGDDGMSPTRLGIGLTGVGLGVAAGVASIALGVMSMGKGNDADELRATIVADPTAPRDNPCGSGSVAIAACTELGEAADDEVTLRNTAIGLGVAAGVVLVGSILYLTIPIDDGAELRASGSGVSVRGSF